VNRRKRRGRERGGKRKEPSILCAVVRAYPRRDGFALHFRFHDHFTFLRSTDPTETFLPSLLSLGMLHRGAHVARSRGCYHFAERFGRTRSFVRARMHHTEIGRLTRVAFSLRFHERHRAKDPRRRGLASRVSRRARIQRSRRRRRRYSRSARTARKATTTHSSYIFSAHLKDRSDIASSDRARGSLQICISIYRIGGGEEERRRGETTHPAG